MKRLFADIHDINVDVPAAYTLLDTLANKLHSKHVLGDSLMDDLPSRYTTVSRNSVNEFVTHAPPHTTSFMHSCLTVCAQNVNYYRA